MAEKKAFVVGAIVGAVVAGVGALIAAQMIEETSTPEFCSSCHEMKPMYETWKTGPHGPLGNKRGAIRAACTQCHLPHGNVVTYLVTKGMSGTRDFIGHIFHGGWVNDPEHWIEKRQERERYVFVSNCEHCHVALPDNIMHEKLKAGEIKGDCLTCHWYVGHGFDLEQKLKEYFSKKGESETTGEAHE
ncbi:cytochrome c3 family protein [Thermovibrio ammonificans]|uniref:NapC/NirT cytochrome c domain protein n=1 Tax=Thermovibrio ammonificans (strain DSM 15698 / JCM 12110 / HB-1) TaxID=648996 RepID=E8T555_THEA1|nr:NapC/NirT family cytochrome c [Thermovibrio ammonificans]ADU96393.1 NapC/NirT cytochrome c domain protein [Thermovibrio ammonificans HB-1]